MSERDAIDRVDEPVTTDRIVDDLRDLGLAPGDTVLVHASLSSLGWVVGGAPAVVDALQEVITPDGTLAMPTHTGQYTDPAAWSNPPVPDDWVPTIRAERPPFRPSVTPTRGVGAVAECFRTYPDVTRSRHPEVSFAAWGADAAAITAEHGYDHGLGEDSPLARLYERDARVLLLGADHGTNTSFHLAEYRAELTLERHTNTAPVLDDAGDRRRIEFEDLAVSDEDFPAIGAAFEEAVGVQRGTVGAATAKLTSQPALVDFAVEWLTENREA